MPFLRSLPPVTRAADLARRGLPGGDGEVLEAPRVRAPRTRMSAKISGARTVAFGSTSLNEIKAIRRHFGVTVNDVVMAIVAGALRSWLDELGDLPDTPLVNYRFDARHTAIRAWISQAQRETDSRVLADAMTAVTRAIAASPPLIVQDGPALLTAWVHGELDSTALAQVTDALSEYPAVRVAVGTTRSGLTGFRRTYQQAERSRIVGPTGHGRLVAYHDVSLVALLLENPDAARAYVLEELGALAADNPNSAVLRDTLLTFLECQCRHLPAADALHLHRNTVAQRVARAEHILRRPTTHRPTELETALRLQRHFDQARTAG